MTDEQWLAGLKAGDEVVLSTAFYGETLGTVTRTTATQIHVGYRKCRRADGREVGAGGWERTRLKQPTPELRDEIEHAELVSTLVSHRWRSTPLTTLRKVVELLRESKPEDQP